MTVHTSFITVDVPLVFMGFIALISLYRNGTQVLLVLLFALLHECIHWLCLLCFGCQQISIRFLPGGIKINAGGLSKLSYRQNIITALSAPLFNLVMACVLRATNIAWLKEPASANFVLGAVNLLPLSILDGGHALYSLIAFRFSSEKTQKITKTVDVFVVIGMVLTAVLSVWYSEKYFSYFIFSAYCLYEVIKKQKSDIDIR